MSAGGDRLKEALQALGLKCGGTVRQRAERLMAVKGKDLVAVDKSLFAKGAAPAVGAWNGRQGVCKRFVTAAAQHPCCGGFSL